MSDRYKKYCFNSHCYDIDISIDIESLDILNRIRGINIIGTCSGHMIPHGGGSTRGAHITLKTKNEDIRIFNQLKTIPQTKIRKNIMDSGDREIRKAKSIPKGGYIIYDLENNKPTSPESNKIWFKSISKMLSKIEFSTIRNEQRTETLSWLKI